MTTLKKQWIICLFAVIMLLSACGEAGTGQPLSGEQDDSEASNEVVEIEFLHMHAGDIIDKMVEEYHKSQNKVRVKPVFVQGNYEGIIEKIQTQAAAKQLPDVFTNGFVYTRFALDTLPVVPASSFVEKDKNDLSDFFPTMLNLGKGDDGKQYAMPFAVSTPILFYNADHFKEAGLDPENPPKTWQDVRDAAKKLTVNGRYGVYFDYNITGNWIYQAMTETAGGQMMSKDLKTVGFDSDAGRKALEYWVDLVNTDKSMPVLDTQQANQSFQSGNISMYVSTTAYLASFREQSQFDIRTATFPSLDGKRVVPAGGNNLVILAQDPKKQEAAWDFVKFATSPKATSMIAQGFGYMVTRNSALEDQQLMGHFLQENPAAKVTYEQIEDMVPWYNFPGSSGSKVYKIVQDNIQAALLQQKSVDQAVKDAATQSNALLN
ncbi:ABC transporter substrate-binding protein [Paenibacillus macerans]|uniref:Bacterial extracellular solute-binding family protein n=1 Tax=Paenibacillus macerans TaxID=44252 RepID=A0A090ZJQ8_PAEMA|nr:ABC transporter substrate-binding protein [Paenibacillus macerans]KFN10608.1 bacterial extracellular solute-binding family protein [Paenibacillus macerans]MCY7561950.1 ABC transporter substrate-binding protein [Paenibacillus macerans]MEC0149561.1 ABC transporter substrate-binding protein [Paenibacillus macerans]SUD26167.1 family 1 extracellular solute-binding protein [Paenibacillus macerans]